MCKQFLTALAIACATTSAIAEEAAKPATRFEKHIQRFEEMDKRQPPERGGILFVGSSSIVRWKLERWFEGMPVLNRGFGGSTLADLNYYAERVVLPYEPSRIVLYSGGNDIAFGKEPKEVVDDLETFLDWVAKNLPQTKLIVLAIKPSTRRVAQWPLQCEANDGFRALAKNRENVVFLDVATPMLNEHGEVDETLLCEDALHLSDKGYALWAGLLMPHLDGLP